ncbi:MAG: helix-turn-helix domain-containing protein [Christensenellales bacterium]
MEQTMRAVQRMQDYIDAHLGEAITLRQLARAAGYSPWHATRLFKEVTGRTPFEYIRALRLSRAALILRDGGDPVIDAALSFVFDSQEGFTRAFTRQFGLPPNRYRAERPPIPLFLPESVLKPYLALHKKGGERMTQVPCKTLFVQPMERPARKLLLKRGRGAKEYFAYCEEVGCDIWGVLCSVQEALYEPVGLWLPDHLIAPGTSQYVQGVELPLDYDKPIPEGFELIELPPCRMLVFQGEPYDDDDFADQVRLVMDQIDRFNPEPYGYRFDPEAAPRFQLAPMGYRGYIEARPVRAIEG